jgi:hypothetical protein
MAGTINLFMFRFLSSDTPFMSADRRPNVAGTPLGEQASLHRSRLFANDSAKEHQVGQATGTLPPPTSSFQRTGRDSPEHFVVEAR